MSLQNTIKCMNKYNRSTLREIQLPEGELTQTARPQLAKQCAELQNILQEIQMENPEADFVSEVVNDLNSPRIANLKQKKEELELRIKQHKPRKPNKPIPKIINSKIANTNK